MRKAKFRVGQVVKKKLQGTYHRVLKVYAHIIPGYEPFYALTHCYTDMYQHQLSGLTERERMEYKQ